MNPQRGEFLRNALREAFDRELAGVVDRTAEEALQSGNGRDVEDATAPLFPHDRQHGSRHRHQTKDIRLVLGTDLLRRGFLKDTELPVSGIVNEDVDASKVLDRRSYRCVHLIFIGHVQRSYEEVIRRAKRLPHSLWATPGGNDLVACCQCSVGDFRADPSRCASHEPYFAHENLLEMSIVNPSLAVLHHEAKGRRFLAWRSRAGRVRAYAPISVPCV